jgi:uncharacterized membrane protein
MAYHEHAHDDRDRDRIPQKHSLRAPPPPRALDIPQPEYTKPKRSSRKSINKSQIRAAVAMIILVIFFVIIVIAAMILHSESYDRTMDKDVNPYQFTFTVPDLASQKVPVVIEVDASNEIYFFIIDGEDFDENLNFTELSTLAKNRNIGPTDQFSYEADFEPGEYSVVAYKRFDVESEINLGFTLTRYILMPFLWLISLIFILLIVLCIVRIALLQRKKSKVHDDGPEAPEYGYDDHYPQGGHGQEHFDRDGRHSYNQDYDHPPQGNPRAPPRHAPPSHARDTGGYSQQTTDYSYESGPPPTSPRPPHRPQRPTHSRDRAQGQPDPTTIPCKCGEVIVINDPSRPLHIQCPRCGRRGILEGKREEADGEIFY